MASCARTALVAVGLLSLSAAASARPKRPIDEFLGNIEAGGRYEPGNVTVKVDPALPVAAVKDLGVSQGCRWDHQFGKRPYHVFECDPERDMATLIRNFSGKRGVRWVEAGFYDEMEATPNDLFELQWYHENTGQDVDGVTGTPGADMSSLDAWEVSTSSDQRVIAIVDIGIYTGHQDLATQVWTNTGENCTNGIDDDNNGYVDDCHGWDIGEQDNDASPLTLPDESSCLRWHATYIAGLAAAQGNNNRGLAGTAWDVSLMNLKRHRDSSCQGTSTRSAEATMYAIDNGADVLGYSFNSTTNSTALRDAIAAADAAGLIAIMSAGNGGSDIDGATRYPNNYPMNHKIITAASNNRDQLDVGSNYGASKVDIAMPGTYVVSTAIDDPQAYGVGSGTSMAVGFGLGAVAIAKTAFPTATAEQVYQAILQGGTAVPSMSCASNTRCVRTGRRLDLLGMLQQLAPLSPASLGLSAVSGVEIGNNDGRYGPGERVLSSFTVTNNGPGNAPGLTGALRVVSGPGLTAVNPTRSFGSLAAGQSSTPSLYTPALEISSTCNTDFDAQVELTVSDVLGRSASTTWTVPVRCMGVAPHDAGVVEDSGTVEPDTGVGGDAGLVSDAGAADDAGQWVRDSGVHWVRDSGVHPDSGSTTTTTPELPRESGCTTGLGAGALWWLLLGLGLSRRRRD